MTAKILAGLLAAVALTGVGIYAATGSVPGADTISSAFSGDTGCAGSCSGSAATACPLSDSEPVSTTNCSACPVDGLAACTGGVSAAVPTPAKKPSCCSE